MTQDLPDWLKEHAPEARLGGASGAPSSRSDDHLVLLRRLLARDYLTRLDWSSALKDLASTAREGLKADRGMIAFLEPGSDQWRAVDDQGRTLDADTISEYGSTRILERVLQSRAPVLTALSESLPVRSESILRQEIHSVLAVPLYWWDVSVEEPRRHLSACLYVHRSGSRGAFAERDVELVSDIARIAQPNLNLLRHLLVVEEELRQHRQALEQAGRWSGSNAHLGDLETRDPDFAREVLSLLRRVSKANKVGLLILGPTGSGKTRLARAYHRACPRASAPFVTLDCSQVTSVETLTAELFGYAPRSGYANAPAQGRPGKAQLADGGTLFIDEIGALPAKLQQHLLRLIQEGVFAPLGSSTEVQVDVQIIAATHNDLSTMVEIGHFREDLYWRVGEIVVRMPPLDERQADIPPLAQVLLERARARFDRDDVESFTPEALHRLVCQPWSRCGNIRGLEHTVNRAVLLAPPGHRQLGPELLDVQTPPSAASEPQRRPSLSSPGPLVASAGRPDEALLRPVLEAAMQRQSYNITQTARDPELLKLLGREQPLPLSTLNLWLRELGLRGLLQQGRERHQQERLSDILDAVRLQGSGSAAARELGMSRDALVWQLRKVGLTIHDVLHGDPSSKGDDASED